MNQEEQDKLFIRKFNILCYATNKFTVGSDKEQIPTTCFYKVEQWLNSKVEGLGKTPLELIQSEEGYNKLLEIINE